MIQAGIADPCRTPLPPARPRGRHRDDGAGEVPVRCRFRPRQGGRPEDARRSSTRPRSRRRNCAAISAALQPPKRRRAPRRSAAPPPPMNASPCTLARRAAMAAIEGRLETEAVEVAVAVAGRLAGALACARAAGRDRGACNGLLQRLCAAPHVVGARQQRPLCRRRASVSRRSRAQPRLRGPAGGAGRDRHRGSAIAGSNGRMAARSAIARRSKRRSTIWSPATWRRAGPLRGYKGNIDHGRQ